MLKRQVAIIQSMTPQERRNPDILKASRKKRIAAGSGTKVEEINKLLKMHRGMADMMKAMGGAKRGPLAGLANALGIVAAACRAPSKWQSWPRQMPGGCRVFRECRQRECQAFRRAVGPVRAAGRDASTRQGPRTAGPAAAYLAGRAAGVAGARRPKGPSLPGLGGFPGFGKKK